MQWAIGKERYDGHHRSCRGWPIRERRRVRAGGPQSPSLTSASRAVVSCSFPRPLLLHYTSTIPSPSNSNSEAACPFSSFAQAAAFQSPLLRALSLSAFSSHPHFRIHIEPTPCRGPSKISSSMTMKKRHVLSVLRSLISQIEVFGPASVVIRFVLTACTGNTLAS
jgi:hypothetical protein